MKSSSDYFLKKFLDPVQQSKPDLRLSLSLKSRPILKNASIRLTVFVLFAFALVGPLGSNTVKAQLNLVTVRGVVTNSKITPKFNLSTKISYNNRFNNNLPGVGYGKQSLMYWFIFWQPNANLDWIKNYWANGQENRVIKYLYSSFPENPYAVVNEFINRTNRNSVTANAQSSYQFTKSLSLQLRTSIDHSAEKRAQERPYDAGSRLPQGSYRAQDILSQETSSDFLVRYNKKLKSGISVNASVGGSQLTNKYNKRDLRTDGLATPDMYELTNNLYPLASIPDTKSSVPGKHKPTRSGRSACKP